MSNLLLLAVLLVAACGSPCDGEPGIRIHVRINPWPGQTWDSTEEVLSVDTVGGFVEVALDPELVGEGGTAEIRLAYPPGTRAGMARVAFLYSFGRPADWRGEATFTADPARCVDVELQVEYVDFSATPDAGVPPSDAQAE